MKCPKCSGARTRVKESRATEEGFAVRRRRECSSCSYRFTTREVTEVLHLSVAKKDGTSEPYQREKLEDGILRALEKRGKTAEAVRSLIARIERDIQKKVHNQEIASHTIGEIVMAALKRFDRVAYIRFASVYRSFDDIDAFQEEVKGLA